MPTDDVLQELFSIRGKVAVVTGGTRGIGLMIAEAYVRAGAKVYVSSRKADVVAETERALSKLGECIGIPADLSTEAECRRLADEVSSREDKVHILVNNAGATWGAPIDEYDDVAFSKVLDLNVKGVFHLTKFLRPQLEAASTEDDPTSVINIGSIDGIQVPLMETYAYSSAKAAVHQLTRHLAKRLAPKVHGERDRAGAVRVEDDEGDARELPRLDRGQRADAAHRPARGHGRGRALPRVARLARTSPA